MCGRRGRVGQKENVGLDREDGQARRKSEGEKIVWHSDCHVNVTRSYIFSLFLLLMILFEHCIMYELIQIPCDVLNIHVHLLSILYNMFTTLSLLNIRNFIPYYKYFSMIIEHDYYK